MSKKPASDRGLRPIRSACEPRQNGDRAMSAIITTRKGIAIIAVVRVIRAFAEPPAERRPLS